MPIQFPSSPALNQEYTYEGKVWAWDGSSWVGVRQQTGILSSTVWAKQSLLIPKRGFGLNSGYNATTDQRRTKAGTIPMLKHNMERNLGEFGTEEIVESGLILYLDAGNASSYPGTGTLWTDLSSSGNNGTLTNGPTYSSANGGSIVFDGSNDFVSGSISTLTSWSISLWYYSTDITSKLVIYPFSGTATPTGLGFGGSFDVNTINRWYFFDGTTTLSSPNNSISINTWYNLVVTKTETSYNLYTNGSLSLSTTGANLSLTQYNLGRRGDNAWYAAGRISQALIYNRALSAAEVTQNYNAVKGRYGL